MKCVIRIIMATITLTIMGSFISTPAWAEGTEKNDYFIKAKIPDNQINKQMSYFDLKMEPKREQVLEVEVYNQSNEKITVKVGGNNANTTSGGVIDYTINRKKDKTLQYPFTSMIEIENQKIEVEPQNQALARVKVTMPEDTYNGVVLGSLIFTKVNNDTEDKEDQSVVLYNEFSYVLGVKLTETDVAVHPDYELNPIKVSKNNSQYSISHPIRNKEAAISKNLKMHIQIIDQETKQEAFTATKSNLEMAPNSVMSYPVTITKELKPGEYQSRVKLEQDGKEWKFERNFTISREEISKINKQNNLTPKNNGLPIWLIAIVGLLVLIVGVQTYVLLRKKRK